MSYNILGINPFHNGSVCVLSDGEIVYFLEEERLSKQKHDANPFRVILDALNRFKIDEIVIAGINRENVKLNYSSEDPYFSLIRKHLPKIKSFYNLSDHHHLTHSFHSFFNSGFKKSISLVVDAGGSTNLPSLEKELDSIYQINFPVKYNTLYKNTVPHFKPKSPLNIAEVFTTITTQLGFTLNDSGKIMGLSSYGKFNPSIPSFFKNKNLSDVNTIYRTTDEFNKSTFHLNFNLKNKDYEWHTNPDKITNIEKDLAWHVQKECQQIVANYIKKIVKETKTKKICCSGGYFLNCVSNYYITKQFPDIDFYFEPVSHDGGTSIGASLWRWNTYLDENNIKPSLKKQTTLYYGPKYSKEELLNGIKKYT